MKRLIFFMAISIECVVGGSTDWNEESRRQEADQVALWESKLVEAQRKPPDSRIADLWLGLRNMGHRRSIGGHSPAIDEAYRKIQQELLSVPGHAQFFADELERLRLDPKSNYERVRPTYLAETLRHLPSPEAIQVLGHYLSDMRDMPYDENPEYNEAVRSGKIRPSDSTPLPQNAWLATCALSNIGLRNPPFEPVGENYIFLRFSPSAESLPKFRAWWEEVKSGKRSFSFVGQKLEYRFKADGSWETVTVGTLPDETQKMPDSAPFQRKNEPEKKRIAKPRPAEVGSAMEGDRENALWKWATAGFFLIMGAVLWVKLRRA